LAANPRAEARRTGLSDEECENIDWVGLEMAARSLARKRELQRKEQPRLAVHQALKNWRRPGHVLGRHRGASHALTLFPPHT